MNDARPGIKMTQVGAELSEQGDSVDPGTGAQVLYVFEPAFHNLARNRPSRLEFPYQKTIEVDEYFLVVRSFAAQGNTHLPKGLKSRGKRTAKGTRRHMSPPVRPGHNHLAKRFEVGLGVDESRIQTTVAQDIGDGFHRGVMC